MERDERLKELVSRAYGLAHICQLRGGQALCRQRDEAFAELASYTRKKTGEKQDSGLWTDEAKRRLRELYKQRHQVKPRPDRWR